MITMDDALIELYRNGEITDVDIEEGLSMKKTISLDEVERSKLLT